MTLKRRPLTCWVWKNILLLSDWNKTNHYLDLGEHVRDIYQKYSEAKANKKGEEEVAAKTKFLAEYVIN